MKTLKKDVKLTDSQMRQMTKDAIRAVEKYGLFQRAVPKKS